jgi:hypothetical protein
MNPFSNQTRSVPANLPWGSRVSIEEISRMPVPEATASYMPVRQDTLFNSWTATLERYGYHIAHDEHWVTKGMDVFISKVRVTAPWLPTGMGFTWETAMINSYNKQVAVKNAVGTTVFVCTNGCLSAEYLMRTKHTTNVWERLQRYIDQSVVTLEKRAASINRLFTAFQSTDAGSDRQVHHVVCRAYNEGVVPASGIGQVLDHWKTPEHAEFKDRNVWSLYNAFTSYDRGRNMFERTTRTNRLQNILNEEFGINAVTPQETANNLV